MSNIDAQRVWLQRIMASEVVGFTVLDENGAMVQCLDNDPALRMALIKYQTQRIRELAQSEATQIHHDHTETNIMAAMRSGDFVDPSLFGFISDGSGGQAADDAAFGDIARRCNNLGSSHGCPLT